MRWRTPRTARRSPTRRCCAMRNCLPARLARAAASRAATDARSSSPPASTSSALSTQVSCCAAVPVAINPDLPAEAIARRLRLVRAGFGLCTADAASTLTHDARVALPCQVISIARCGPGLGNHRMRRRSRNRQIPSFLQLTSGTTGEPRAVVISHRNLTASLAVRPLSGSRCDHADVLATWVPLHHDLGLVRYVFGAMLSGCPSHLIRPSMANLRPWLELVARCRRDHHRWTRLRLPPRARKPSIPITLPSRSAIASLRREWGRSGQARHHRGLRAPLRLARRRPSGLRVGRSDSDGDQHRASRDSAGSTSNGIVSCGRPLNGIELRIADSDGRRRRQPVLSARLLVRGLPCSPGTSTMRRPHDARCVNGWLHTGDVGHVDADGYLFVKGRSRALIKRGGAAIAPSGDRRCRRIAAPGVRSSAAFGAVLSSLVRDRRGRGGCRTERTYCREASDRLRIPFSRASRRK